MPRIVMHVPNLIRTLETKRFDFSLQLVSE